MVQNIVDMGFSRTRVEETLRRVCIACTLAKLHDCTIAYSGNAATFCIHGSGVLGIARHKCELCCVICACLLALMSVKTGFTGMPLCSQVVLAQRCPVCVPMHLKQSSISQYKGIKTERFCHTVRLCRSHATVFTKEPNQDQEGCCTTNVIV